MRKPLYKTVSEEKSDMEFKSNIQKKLTACFGDSITQGQPGVTYIKYLDKKIYKNYGLGGDNLVGMFKRLKSFVKHSSCSNFVIEIGANDIFLPFLSSFSSAWKKRIEERSRTSIDDPDKFNIQYRKLLDLLYDNTAVRL
jgi:lysophospholipase L1-like esterase